MCCSGKPYRQLRTNETLENSFSISPSAELTTQGKQKFTRSSATREEMMLINFQRKKLKPPASP